MPANGVAMRQELWGVLEELQKMACKGERIMRLVVNSRMDLGGGLGGGDQIHLGALPAADAQQLLLLHGGKEAQWEKGQAAQLAGLCGGNPLALTLVGGLIAARRCTPKVRYQLTIVLFRRNSHHGSMLYACNA
jgi:hypothetical protein